MMEFSISIYTFSEGQPIDNRDVGYSKDRHKPEHI